MYNTFNRLHHGIKIVFLAFVLINTIFSSKAYAYIDPGTGSFVFQVLIAFLVGAIFSIKVYWKSLRSLFVSIFTKRQKCGEKDGVEK